MARRYDSRTTIFSPEGRLYQVEYAMEAISNAGTCLGIVAKDGIVIAAEKKVPTKLLEKKQASEKLYIVDNHISCAVAGLTADASRLIETARLEAQRHRIVFDEEIAVEELVRSICDTKQAYTQRGGLRPYGVSFLFAGWDKQHGFQLYQTDPSGNYGGWKAQCIGTNSSAAQSILKEDYKPELTVDETLLLVTKILDKTMDSNTLTAEKLDIAKITREGKNTVYHSLTAAELSDVMKRHEVATAAEKAKEGEKEKK